MKKQSRKRKASKVKRVNATVKEFETTDLAEVVRASGVRPAVIRPQSRMTSIILDDVLIAKLRRVGAKRGLGYQTMLKVIVREHISEY